MTPGAAPGGQEVLAHGSEEPARRPRRGVLAVGAACVAAGFAAGLLVSGEDVGALFSTSRGQPVIVPASTSHPVPVAAGAVSASAPPVPGRFGLSVFNWGRRELTAEIVSLPGWLPPLSERTTTRIGPHSWGLLRFSAPVYDCRVSPGHVRVVVVEVRTKRAVTSYVVPLAEPADGVLRAHRDQICGERGWRPNG